MIFSKKNAGKWVASKDGKVLAIDATLSAVLKKVEKEEQESIILAFVPPTPLPRWRCMVASRLLLRLQPGGDAAGEGPQVAEVVAHVGVEEGRGELDVIVDENVAEALRIEKRVSRSVARRFSAVAISSCCGRAR